MDNRFQKKIKTEIRLSQKDSRFFYFQNLMVVYTQFDVDKFC
jgi:hypothetical protein